MAGPIKLFVTVRNIFQAIGVHPPKKNVGWRLTWKNIFAFYFNMQTFIPNLAYCVFEAKNFFEYGAGIYSCTCQIALTFLGLLEIVEIENVFGWIEKVEQLINCRE